MFRLTASLLVLVIAAGCTDAESDDNSNTGGSSGSGGSTSTGGSGGSSTGGSGGSSTGGGTSSGGSGGDAGVEPDGGPDANAPDASAPDASVPDAGQPGLVCDVMPTQGLLAVFRVAGTEYFRAQITDPQGKQQAIDLWQGNSTANIPNGALICEPADYNCGYSWHLDPADIEFADVTIEICDGTPSYVEDHCTEFGGRYCTWAAELIELYDCSVQGCTLVAK